MINEKQIIYSPSVGSGLDGRIPCERKIQKPPFNSKSNFFRSLPSSRCVHITDIGVGYISTMLSLSALFLRWCSQVRDFGLQHLCSMRNLQVLSLAGKLTKEPHLRALLEQSVAPIKYANEFPHLQPYLRLYSGCPLLTSSGLSSLIQLRHLQELELTNCPGATQELFEYLHEHLPRCTIIE